MGKTVCISYIKHQTHATEVRERSFNPASLWEATLRTHKYNMTVPILEVRKLRPRAGVPCPVQLAVKTAQPVAWSRTRGRKDVTSGQTELSQTLRVPASRGTSLQLTLHVYKMLLAGSCEDQTGQCTRPGL